MREKEAQIEKLKGELSDITAHFEENWKTIQEKDATIVELKKELQTLIAQQDRSGVQAETYGDHFSQWNLRLTELEDRDALISSNLHTLRNELNKIQFETNKMKENPPTQVRLPIEDEIDKLASEREDSRGRINEIRKLTDMIHEEGTREMQTVETDLENEKQQKVGEVQALLQRKESLIQSIHNVETELSQCITHLNNECQAIRMTMRPCESDMSDLSKLEEENKTLQKEIQTLEDNISRDRRAEVERQDMIKTIERRLAERQETNEKEMEQVNLLMKKEEQAIASLRAKLDAQISKNEEVEQTLQKEHNKINDGINVEEELDKAKEKLEDEFAAQMRKDMDKKATTKKELKKRIEAIKRINSNMTTCAQHLQKLSEETKKRSTYAKKKDKKSHAVVVTIGELEGELDALHQINEREKSPEAIAEAKNQEQQRQLAEANCISFLQKELQRVKSIDQQNRQEMHRLEAESRLLSDHKIELEKQNHALIKYLIPYEKLRRYYVTHSSLWRKPKPNPPNQRPPGGPRVVLECGNVSIQAS